jgi:hypothetical protein
MEELKVRTRVLSFQRDAHDVGKWPRGGPQRPKRDAHGRQLRHEDGRAVMERLPSTASVLMLNPNGDEVWLPLQCGSGKPDAEHLDGLWHGLSDPFFMKMSKEKLKKGFLPMENCPKAFRLQEHFHADFPTEDLHTAPCELAANGKPIGQYDFCKCIIKERELRRKVSAQLTQGINDRYRDKHTLDIESRNAQTDAIVEALKVATETQKKGKR